MTLKSLGLTALTAVMGLVSLIPAAQAAPAPVCDVRTYGAQGNGAHLDTEAIQRAVDDCKGKSGIVHFPAGKYLSGTITLGGDMTVHLDAGATLLGVQAGDEAYPDLSPDTNNSQLINCRKALLYADGAANLTIEGPGTIDGNGWWGPWTGNVKENKRPMALFMVKATNLNIRDLQVKNSAMWSVVLMENEVAHVTGLNVHSPTGPTRDGIDIVDGHDITIENSAFFSEDDSICLKSGVASGLQKITVRNSRILGSLVANGLKFGTASKGPLRDVLFENIDIEHVQQAAMAIESVDGSKIQGITFKNISFHDVGAAVYVLLGWRGNQGDPRPGSIADLTFQNIDGESSRQTWGSAVSGTAINGALYAPTNILFQNVRIKFKGNPKDSAGHLPAPPPEYQGQYPDPRLWGELPSAGLYFRHVKQVHFRGVQLINTVPEDKRPLIIPNSNANDFDAP